MPVTERRLGEGTLERTYGTQSVSGPLIAGFFWNFSPASREEIRDHRKVLRLQGLVSMQLWCPRSFRTIPRFNPWVRKISWRRKRQPTPVFLPRESHGQRSLTGYSSLWGHKESDTTEQLSTF